MISVVWIDHDEARVFELSSDRMERSLLRSGRGGTGALAEQVSGRLRDARQVLLLGRSASLPRFREWLLAHAPDIAAKVVGCETVEEPSDGQIASFAAKYFRMSGA